VAKNELIEKASVVFKETSEGNFEVTKARHGQLTIGGKYSKTFAEVYAKTYEDVLVLENAEGAAKRSLEKIKDMEKAVIKQMDDSWRKVAREAALWAKIGRKPNEFKVGDAVRYKKAFTTVVDSVPGLIRIDQPNNNDKYIAVNPSDLTLVFPAEARFE
jgi:hypothetical protein